MIETLIALQHTAEARNMRITGIAVDPEIFPKLQEEFAELANKPVNEQPMSLAGMNITPYYPETARLQARMQQLNMIHQFGAYLRDNGVGVNRIEGELTPEEYNKMVYAFLGIGYDALVKEQESIKARKGNAGEIPQQPMEVQE